MREKLTLKKRKQQAQPARPADLPPDLDPKNRDVMTSLMALARAIAELRQEVQGGKRR